MHAFMKWRIPELCNLKFKQKRICSNIFELRSDFFKNSKRVEWLPNLCKLALEAPSLSYISSAADVLFSLCSPTVYYKISTDSVVVTGISSKSFHFTHSQAFPSNSSISSSTPFRNKTFQSNVPTSPTIQRSTSNPATPLSLFCQY